MYGSSQAEKCWGMSWSFISWPEGLCSLCKRMATRMSHGHASFHCAMRKMRIPKQRYNGQQRATLPEFYGEQSFWGWNEVLAFTAYHSALDSGPNSGEDQLGSDCYSSFVLKFFSQPAFFCFCWNETQNKTCLTFKLLCWWLIDPLHGLKLTTSSLAISFVPSEKQGNELHFADNEKVNLNGIVPRK